MDWFLYDNGLRHEGVKRELELFYTELVLLLWSIGTVQEYLLGPLTVFKKLQFFTCTYKTLCAIWYHLYNLKNLKNTHERVLLSVRIRPEACNFTKSKPSSMGVFHAS